MSSVRIAIVGVAIVYLAGCGGSSESTATDPPLPDIEPICDGSDDSRLVYASTAGYGSVFDAFSADGGDRYLVVDGHCDYVLKEGSLLGLRTGHLDLERATTLAANLEFGRYSSVENVTPVQCFADVGISVLADDSARLVNRGCEPTVYEPRVWSAAFKGIWRLMDELLAQSQPAWQPTRLLAVRAPTPINEAKPVAWTAALDLEDRAVDVIDLMVGLDPTAGVVVEDSPTLALLSELRLSALARDAFPTHLYVRDANARPYYVLLRDTPPPAISEVVVAALASAQTSDPVESP